MTSTLQQHYVADEDIYKAKKRYLSSPSVYLDVPSNK